MFTYSVCTQCTCLLLGRVLGHRFEQHEGNSCVRHTIVLGSLKIRERERETLFGQIFQRDGSVGAQFGVVGC
jgi:hypothetical protein